MRRSRKQGSRRRQQASDRRERQQERRSRQQVNDQQGVTTSKGVKRTTTIKKLIILALITISCNPAKQLITIPEIPPKDCFNLPKYGDPSWDAWTNKDLGKYFRSMRQTDLKCHSHFFSDMHTAMQIWRNRFGKDASVKDVEKYLGEPDLIINADNISKYDPPKDEILQIAVREIPKNPSLEFKIYFWRDWHDYLWFKTENKKVINADMYYAYE